MKIEIAASDLLAIRRLVAEKHADIAAYPIMSSAAKPGFDGVRKAGISDMAALRKLHKRLTLAIRRVNGHDCCPEILDAETSK